MSHLGESARIGTVSIPGTWKKKNDVERFLTSPGDVVALGRLANLVNGLDGLVIELDLLEVGADARKGDRLGDDAATAGRGAADLGPGEDDLGGGDLVALGLGEAVGDVLDLGGVDEEGQAEAVVAEGRVGGDVDVLGVAVGDEILLGQLGVALDLVDGGDDISVLDDGLDLPKVSEKGYLVRRSGSRGFPYLLSCEVGDTDGPDLGLGQLRHGCQEIVSASAIYEGLFQGFQFVHVPFQVSEMETPSSRATSSLLSDFVGERTSPLGKATGQWMR